MAENSRKTFGQRNAACTEILLTNMVTSIANMTDYRTECNNTTQFFLFYQYGSI